GLAFGADALGIAPGVRGCQTGGVDGVGGPVVLAGDPDDRVGLGFPHGRHRDPGAERQGGLTVAHGLLPVAVVLVGGDAVVGVELVKGLLSSSHTALVGGTGLGAG